jgi:hypothetical protein
MRRKRRIPKPIKDTLSLVRDTAPCAVQEVVDRCRRALAQVRAGGTRADVRQLAEAPNAIETAVKIGHLSETGLIIAAEAEGAITAIERQGMIATPAQAAAVEQAIDVYGQVIAKLKQAEVLGLLQATAKAQDEIREAA